MSIKENLQNLKSQIPDNVTLVAVSKTKPIEDIMEAYNSGHRDFGENKIQDMVDKYNDLPKDIRWHMIGHVQRNKVKYMAEFVHLIHGVDSLKLLKEINKHAKKHDRIIDCLLQIKIAEEDSKFGMSKEDAVKLINSGNISDLKNVKIIGLMGMATFTDNQIQIKKEFKYLSEFYANFNHLKGSNIELNTISMGMSDDYKLAIDCGSNMIRVGSRIFGSRNY